MSQIKMPSLPVDVEINGVTVRCPHEEPSFILIRAKVPLSQNVPPSIDEHDRIDWNKREHDQWQKMFWQWLSGEMKPPCRVYRDGRSIGGMV